MNEKEVQNYNARLVKSVKSRENFIATCERIAINVKELNSYALKFTIKQEKLSLFQKLTIPIRWIGSLAIRFGQVIQNIGHVRPGSCNISYEPDAQKRVMKFGASDDTLRCWSAVESILPENLVIKPGETNRQAIERTINEKLPAEIESDGIIFNDEDGKLSPSKLHQKTIPIEQTIIDKPRNIEDPLLEHAIVNPVYFDSGSSVNTNVESDAKLVKRHS